MSIETWTTIKEFEDIKLERTADGVAKVTINRPEVRNAFRPQTVEELLQAFVICRDNAEIGVVILTGEGDLAFCSGGDQRVRGHGGYVGADGIPRLNVLDLQKAIRSLPKPVIAMVAGYAIGGGHVLQVVCDISIAADNARFGQTGPKVGSFDGGLGSSYLSRIVGQKKAREIWFLCRQYDAKQALEMGLVNTVVPLAELESETLKWCREILANSPLALRMLKAALNADCDGQMGLLDLAGNATLLYYLSEEAAEGRTPSLRSESRTSPSSVDFRKPMIFYSSKYELQAVRGKKRWGFLLKVQFDDGLIGYADVHPWKQFGDRLVISQINSLIAKDPLPLAKRSIELARVDAVARAEGRWLFDGLTVPHSHKSLPFGFTVEDVEKATNDGFTIIKVKWGSFLPDLLPALAASDAKIRIDFNGYPKRGADHLLAQWGFYDWLDWIEDPGPYNNEFWNSLKDEFGVRIALDLEQKGGETAYDIYVLKPARDGLDVKRAPDKSLAVTSYLDHPVGQMFAAWTAAVAVSQGLPVETCGLITHTVYEENLFSRQIKTQGPSLIPPEGTGIGFDEELASLEWTRLQ